MSQSTSNINSTSTTPISSNQMTSTQSKLDTDRLMKFCPVTYWKYIQPPFCAASAGMLAITIVQPIDFVKVRLQLVGENAASSSSSLSSIKQTSASSIIRHTIATRGPIGLYDGLSAALLRQATYTTARLSIYSKLTTSFSSQVTSTSINQNGETITTTKNVLPFSHKFALGLTSGAIGSIIGTPCDVALTRMQSDATLPIEQRRNYKNVFDAITTIIRREGFFSIFKGGSAVVARAMALNSTMLATHDECLEILNNALPSQPRIASFIAKSFAGTMAAFSSLPFDLIKTRLQKQTIDPITGELPYKSFLHCAKRIATEEGIIKGFYKGIGPYCMRIAPTQILTLYFYNQFLDSTKIKEKKKNNTTKSKSNKFNSNSITQTQIIYFFNLIDNQSIVTISSFSFFAFIVILQLFAIKSFSI